MAIALPLDYGIYVGEPPGRGKAALGPSVVAHILTIEKYAYLLLGRHREAVTQLVDFTLAGGKEGVERVKTFGRGLGRNLAFGMAKAALACLAQVNKGRDALTAGALTSGLLGPDAAPRRPGAPGTPSLPRGFDPWFPRTPGTSLG